MPIGILGPGNTGTLGTRGDVTDYLGDIVDLIVNNSDTIRQFADYIYVVKIGSKIFVRVIDRLHGTPTDFLVPPVDLVEGYKIIDLINRWTREGFTVSDWGTLAMWSPRMGVDP